MIRVVVIDDHPIVRDGLVRLIGSDPELEVVGSGGDGDAAVTICAELDPDVALMDLSMPGVGGVEATRLIGERAPGVQVIVLTSFMDRERVTEALDAGAIGYLLKDAEPGQLLHAIHAAARGESPLDPRAARAMLAAQRTPDRLDTLTVRETVQVALDHRHHVDPLSAMAGLPHTWRRERRCRTEADELLDSFDLAMFAER